MTTTSSPPSPGYQNALRWLEGRPKGLLIGGGWVPAASGKTFNAINPATEAVLGAVAEGDAADVAAAVGAARRALEAPSWSALSPHARTRALLRIADTVENHAEELAALETLDVGMPLWYSTAVLKLVVDTFRYYAGWCTKILGTTNPTDPSTLLYTLRQPIGVCGLITAWNGPTLMAAIKAGSALCCGNAVVLKPSELASLATVRLLELIQETDLPPGVVNLVTGPGSTAGAALAEHPEVDKISFTGSTATGKRILNAATPSLKRVTLELGGKSPHVIFQDADLDRAIEAAVSGFTRNSGQICSAGTRLFVHESLVDEVSARVAEIARAQTIGSPLDPATKLGPLVSAPQLDRVDSYIQSGLQDGAQCIAGGARVPGPGYFVQPTVFRGVNRDMKIAREEIFGPVVAILPFKDEDDAILQGNDSSYGLAAGLWTRDVARAHKVARALKAGRVWVNTYGETDPVMPFGGFKQSGLGREYGSESLEAYLQTKSVLVRLQP